MSPWRTMAAAFVPGTCCHWWPLVGGPGMQAGRRPIVTQARRGLGGEKCPRGSHHGYVRARRTRPAWPRSPGEDRVATWETAPTGVERELKSTGGLRLACGRRQSGGWSSLACLGGGISEAPRSFLRGPLRVRIRASHWPLGSLLSQRRQCVWW